MTAPMSSEHLYNFACNCFDYLRLHGFEKVGLDQKTIFRSSLFQFVIAQNRYGEPPHQKLLSGNGKTELVSPYIALQFFLDNYIEEWRSIEGGCASSNAAEKSIWTGARLLEKYPWVFLDEKWSQDQNLLQACEAVRDWYSQRLSKGDVPTHVEIIRRLHAENRP